MSDVDRVIHEPVRLKIVTMLSGLGTADFNFLVSTLGLSKGNLSSHMDRLERAGYVKIVKEFNGKVPHTDYRLTASGRKALTRYWRAIEDIKNGGF